MRGWRPCNLPRWEARRWTLHRASILNHQYVARFACGFSCRARRADEEIFKGHGRGGATPPGAKRRGAASNVLMIQDTSHSQSERTTLQASAAIACDAAAPEN